MKKKDWGEKKGKMYVFTIRSSSGIDREKKFFFLEKEKIKYLGGIYNKFHIISVCHNEFCFLLRGHHKCLCSFELWTERNLYRGRLHRFWRRKTAREKRKNVCFPHYITCGPPQREKKFFFREIKMKRFLNFYYATTNEWMRGEHKFL